MAFSLELIPFRNHVVAERNFRSIVELLSEQSTTILRVLLRQSPDPDSSLNHLERFLKTVAAKGEPFLPHGNRLPTLITVFGNSHFLAETLFRYPNLLQWTLNERRLYRVLSTKELFSELGSFSPDTTDDEAARTLAQFKRKHLLRIVIRDLLHFGSLAEITEELSNLSDAILQGGQDHIHQQLVQRFGSPLTRQSSSSIESHFVVLALGKLGGQELNYSSDIDLMYLYTSEAKTSGPVRISGRKFFAQLSQRLTRMLSQITPDGFCFRVDLRLRPEGSSGELALPLLSAIRYYATRARDWELQMLIKARAAAGNRALGDKFLEMVEPLIYRTPTDFSTIEHVAATRDRIQKNLARRQDNGINVKLSRGGIRDIEFLVQCLQRLYGGHEPWVRSKGTLLSLHRLHDKGYLSPQDYSCLHAAYCYLRSLEHRLQIEHNRQVHTLPLDAEAQLILLRKIHGKTFLLAKNLTSEVSRHLQQVSDIYTRVIGSQCPMGASQPLVNPIQVDDLPEEHLGHSNWTAQIQHLKHQSPRLAKTVADLPIHWGRQHFEHFLNNLVSSPDLVATCEKHPETMRCIGDLIEHSPYLAEQIIRHPADALELQTLIQFQRTESYNCSPDQRPLEKHIDQQEALLTADFGSKNIELNESSALLRRYYRRRMLELLTKSVYFREPVFATLDATSRLAESVIRQAFKMAAAETERTLGQPQPRVPLQIIALGRLGMREFDLGSDADLVFVLPDEGESATRWWSQAVEILVEIMSSHTSDGILFSVDSRLRPMGRDGTLIQIESRFKKYFSDQAEPWEAITYMKARTVAGDLHRGTKFLTELQDVDWQRYGRSGELASNLVVMRTKIENSQGAVNPIKAGRGGYYDVDFILMYLRLRNAGLFFPSLNTPERIAILRTTKALSPKQADTLEMAAEFLSSLNHAIRVAIGPSANKLPGSVSQRNIVSNLVGRWTRIKTNSGTIGDTFEMVRQDTRELFQQVFSHN